MMIRSLKRGNNFSSAIASMFMIVIRDSADLY